MSSDESAAVESAGTTDTPAKQKNPLRPVALWVLLLACLLFVMAVFMERRTPSSSQATVSAYVVGIAPEVTGRVIEVGVADNSGVTAGQMLFRIDPSQYELAVAQAEARLAGVGQSIGASTASVDTVQARWWKRRRSANTSRSRPTAPWNLFSAASMPRPSMTRRKPRWTRPMPPWSLPRPISRGRRRSLDRRAPTIRN